MSDRSKQHVTETPDTSYIKNVDVTHEVSDVSIGGIGKFVVALVVLMVVSFLLMWAMFGILDSRVTEPERSPMALSEKERLPPEPRLQGAPGFADQLEQNRATKEPKPEAHATPHGIQPPKDALWEMQVLREHWEDVLKNGPSDQSGKRYGMPIEKAKEEVLKELKVRKQ